MKRKVVVNDRMQKGYVYCRTEPVGRRFAPGFEPQLTPNQMLELGVFGGKYMTDCRDEFPASWFARAKLCAERHDPAPQLLWCERVTVARGLAAEGLDHPAGSTRVVSVVLPVLPGPPDGGRRATDPAVARHRAARLGDSEALREGRPRLPPQTATGRPALGL
jgi:hypothetical protein